MNNNNNNNNNKNLNKKRVTVSLLGDIAIECVNTPFQLSYKINYGMIFSKLIPYISETDVVISNLEGPIPLASFTKRKKVLLANRSGISAIFKNKHIVFGLSNNHIFDFGKKSFLNTKKILEKSNVISFGAGINETEASRPVYIYEGNLKICLLAFSSDELHIGSTIATKDQPGVISYQNIDLVKKTIEKQAKICDFVLISLHWGIEYFQYPEPWQISYARSLIDSGASVIIGHHPHVIQGYEYYKKGLIFYSLGNLFIPPIYSTDGIYQVTPKETTESTVFQIALEKDKKPEIINVLCGDTTSSLAIKMVVGKKHKERIRNIKKLSIKFQDDAYYNFYSKYKNSRSRMIRFYKKIRVFKKIKHTPLGLLVKKIFEFIPKEN